MTTDTLLMLTEQAKPCPASHVDAAERLLLCFERGEHTVHYDALYRVNF